MWLADLSSRGYVSCRETSEKLLQAPTVENGQNGAENIQIMFFQFSKSIQCKYTTSIGKWCSIGSFVLEIISQVELLAIWIFFPSSPYYDLYNRTLKNVHSDRKIVLFSLESQLCVPGLPLEKHWDSRENENYFPRVKCMYNIFKTPRVNLLKKTRLSFKSKRYS